MPFAFAAAPTAELRQGELLGDVWLHRAVAPASELAVGAQPNVVPTPHPFAVVLHADCDLLQDYRERKRAFDAGEVVSPSKSVLQILMCEAFVDPDIRPQFQATENWKRAKKNQDERYQYLEFEPIQGVADAPSSPLLLDFRRAFSVFTEDLYSALLAGSVRRIGVIPAVHLHDLMHRFYGYLSRVGLPD